MNTQMLKNQAERMDGFVAGYKAALVWVGQAAEEEVKKKREEKKGASKAGKREQLPSN